MSMITTSMMILDRTTIKTTKTIKVIIIFPKVSRIDLGQYSRQTAIKACLSPWLAALPELVTSHRSKVAKCAHLKVAICRSSLSIITVSHVVIRSHDLQKSVSHRCPALAASSSSSSSWRPYDPNQKYDVYTGRYEDPQADYSDISDDELSHDAPHTEEEHDSYYFNRRHKQRMKTASRRGTKYVQHADDPENQDDNNFPDGDTVIETKFKDGSSNQCSIKEEPYLYVSAHSFEDENKVPWWKNFARSEYDDKNRLTQMVYELLDKQHWKSTARRKLRKNLVQSDAIRFLHRHGWSSTPEEKLKIARGIMKRKGPILPVPEYDESQKWYGPI